MHVSQAAFWLSLENIFKILGRLSWNTRAVRTCWFRKRLRIYYLYKHISSWLNIRPVGASQSRVNWGQIWRWPSNKPFIFILLVWVDKAALIKYKLDNKTTWVRLQQTLKVLNWEIPFWLKVFTYKQKIEVAQYVCFKPPGICTTTHVQLCCAHIVYILIIMSNISPVSQRSLYLSL